MLLNRAETLARTPFSRFQGVTAKSSKMCHKVLVLGTSGHPKHRKARKSDALKNPDPKIWCKVLPRPQNEGRLSSRECARNHTNSKNLQNGHPGWPRPPKMTKTHGLGPPKSIKKHLPKPIEYLKNAAPKFPRNLDLAKARWRVMRTAHWIYMYMYIYIYDTGKF